ncbi:metal ion-binding protein isoform X2 [Wolffia australiana]
MVDQWEPIIPDSVKTPLEVYEELQTEGYIIDYERVPITDEKAPKEQDFDILVQRIAQADLNTEIIFNCQMGRGRTTTGMVIATLVYLNRIGASGIPRTSSIGKIFSGGAAAAAGDNIPDSEEAIRRGEYAVIRSLIRVLEGGVEGKKQVDKVIDRCASMQNLREAIAGYRNSILRQPDEMKRAASLSFFVEYLERYYFLICFAVYIHTERAALRTAGSDQVSFADWMRARPELYSILRRLLRRNPMGALGCSAAKPKLMKIAEAGGVDRPCEMSIVAALRSGEVLGRQTVLKSDHCPGCQNHALPERVDGAPNFRGVAGFPVYGVANPTVDGIRAVIRRIGARRPILWHNMREEPVVYINGRPFVLREAERPFKNMLEYTGIDRERVERMEARLKEDILREAGRYGGAIMVVHETEEGQIFDAWERVGADSVQTPLQVYQRLEAEGLPIQYARVPITDGKAPKSSDFDAIALNVAAAPADAALVFNCQMGRGRTTTGTVIACLLVLRIWHGRPLTMPAEAEKGLERLPDWGSSSGSEEAPEEGGGGGGEEEAGRQRRCFVIDDIPLIKKLTRLFDNGVACREVLDAVIDRCSALQNIRQAVLQYRRVFNQQHAEPRVRRVALYRGGEYLERYFRLIAFAAYLGSDAFDGFCGQGQTRVPFKTWLHQRQEVQATKWSIRLRPGRFFTAPEPSEQQQAQGDLAMEAIVKARNGSVLAKGSILKSGGAFPGQDASSAAAAAASAGVEALCQAAGFPVYSLPSPTTANGAKEMLRRLAAAGAQKLVVTDLREEAVVYIKGAPFVLRELDHPEDTLKHVGITGPLVEHMERRLKEDVVAELAQRGGQMLLHRDETNPVSGRSCVVGYRETLAPDDVTTAAELFAALALALGGCALDYLRVPISRERDPLASDVDAVRRRRPSPQPAAVHLFISQPGAGGAAYAMAITCLGLGAGAGDDQGPATPSPPPSEVVAGDEMLRHGDYRDILSLTRVLTRGPRSKAEVDLVIDRCAAAGHLRDDIFRHKKELERCADGDEELRTHIMDMGIKALRRYFFLIAFREYLHSSFSAETTFANWMAARPELGHLCDNLRLD